MLRDLPLSDNQQYSDFRQRGVVPPTQAALWVAYAAVIQSSLFPSPKIHKHSVIIKDGAALTALASDMEKCMVLAGVAMPVGESDRRLKAILDHAGH